MINVTFFVFCMQHVRVSLVPRPSHIFNVTRRKKRNIENTGRPGTRLSLGIRAWIKAIT